MMSDCLPVYVGFLYESRPIRRISYTKIPSIRAGDVNIYGTVLRGIGIRLKKYLRFCRRAL